jgi:hypothetical protein
MRQAIGSSNDWHSISSIFVAFVFFVVQFLFFAIFSQLSDAELAAELLCYGTELQRGGDHGRSMACGQFRAGLAAGGSSSKSVVAVDVDSGPRNGEGGEESLSSVQIESGAWCDQRRSQPQGDRDSL